MEVAFAIKLNGRGMKTGKEVAQTLETTGAKVSRYKWGQRGRSTDKREELLTYRQKDREPPGGQAYSTARSWRPRRGRPGFDPSA